MKYKDFEIRNFRGIKELDINDFADVNLIVGKNNASKTSILESIFVLSGSLNTEILLRINLFRGLGFNEQDDFRLIFYNLNYNENIILKGIGYVEDKRELEIFPLTSEEKTKSIPKRIKPDGTDLTDYYSNLSHSSINQLSLKTSIKLRHNTEKKESPKISYTQGEFRTEIATIKGIPFTNSVFVSQNLGLSPNLEKELENLIITKQYFEIVEVLQQVDSSIKNLTLGHNKMIYIDNGLDRLIPINLLGDGIRRLLGVILAIYNARNGTILIDEIDNGLHFSALKSLWKSVIYTAKKCNVQVFVTTHNFETIKYLSECLGESDYVQYQDKVKTFTIRKLENGIHKSYGYDFSQFSNAIDEDIEIR
tara:strand:- start:446 stop:1540 length:1095 start_codon:yes stop_codon:yes gene_type:complete